MDNARLLFPLALGIALLDAAPAGARPRFNASEIQAGSSQFFLCDFDGDGLKDFVFLTGTSVSIFYQDAQRGFTREPQQTIHLDDRSAVVWPARLGRNAESLLVMAGDGVTELDFTGRTSPPSRRQIIREPTFIPEGLEETQIAYFPLLAKTDGDWPLLLVPVADGLEIWRHRDDWERAQVIADAFTTESGLFIGNPGYGKSTRFSLSAGDLNGDRRDDLVIRRSQRGTEMETYAIYLQQSGGEFAREPALVYTNRNDWRSWLCWIDLNHDGKVDLIKSTWLGLASFIPGVPSGKVVAGAYLADAGGKIPAEPQAVFRKDDWTPALPVVDLDGDGFPDVALGFAHFDKEGLRRQVTAKQLEFNLKISFYRPGAGFPKTSDCQRDVVIHLDQPEMAFSWTRPEFFTRFVNLTGDFNGDGKKDLLVRDHSDHVSIYFFASRERGFNAEADLKFNCPEAIDWLEADDLNGDGVSDLFVKLQDRPVFRIYLSDGK